MLAAIEQAKLARGSGNFGIGAVVVKNHHVIAQAGDLSKNSIDPTNHAPLLAIRQAAASQGTSQLDDCVIYCTLECCPMCATAIVSVKLGGVVIGNTLDEIAEYNAQGKLNHIGKILNISATSIIEKSPYEVFLVPGFMNEECRSALEMGSPT